MATNLSETQILDVIRRSLSSVLSQEDLDKAITCWVGGEYNCFSDVSSYVAVLKDRVGLNGHESKIRATMRIEMVKAISRASNLHDSGSVSSTIPSKKSNDNMQLGADENAPVYHSNNITGQDIVFNVVLDKMVDAYTRQGKKLAYSDRQSILDRIGNNNFSPKSLQQLKMWKAPISGIDALRGFTIPEMSAVIHGIYVWVCEINSPIAADHILDEAIRESEKLPEANELSPRRLL